MAFDLNSPFNDLPTLPPGGEVETRAVLKKCIAANRAIAELKGLGQTLPNQAMLINAIPLQEAKMSSAIENIVTTQDSLFRAALDESKATDPHTKEVLRYREALRLGSRAIRRKPMDLELIAELCTTLRGEPVDFRANNQVVLANPITRKAYYTPPAGQDVMRKLLKNFEDYLSHPQDDLDPLVRLALLHYQFEAIHPFDDGNGRTGRIINLLYLLQTGLLDIPVLYLSRHIIQTKNDYYRLLMNVTTKGAWEEWILYMLSALHKTTEWTISRVLSIRDLFAATVERCKRDLPSTVYSKELVELIFSQPYCRIATVVDAGIAKRQTASNYLKELEKIGVLTGERSGRDMIYRHPDLIQILTE